MLMIQRRTKIRKSHDLFDRMEKSRELVKMLQGLSANMPIIKPFLSLFQAYIELLRGRKSASASNMLKCNKLAISQGNIMLQAWIEQNKRVSNLCLPVPRVSLSRVDYRRLGKRPATTTWRTIGWSTWLSRMEFDGRRSSRSV